MRIRELLAWSRYELHEHPAIKFFLVFATLFGYFLFASFKFGANDGLLISALTWSFFVLCTPVADAGFLLDLPLRLFTGIRMVLSEILVWVLAIGLNVFVLATNPAIYDDTLLLGLFKHILTQPFPYWAIIILSSIGTFLSILFGDELLDVAKEEKDTRHHHKKHHLKHRFLIFLALIVLVLIFYDYLLNSLGISIPLF